MNTRTTLFMASLTFLPAALAFAAPAPQPDDPKATVKSLLNQLENDPSDAQRVAAEWALLKLGPNILPLLPQPETASSNLKERLAQIRATLEELRPRTWTVERAAMPLAQALLSLKKQTGLTLADRRQTRGDQAVTFDFRTATYWEAVQTLAAKTDSRLSLYQPDGQVALIDGPASKEPVDLRGLFRVAVKRLGVRLDFDSQTRTGVLGLEIAWEPRFSPYLIEVGKLSFHAGAPPKGPASVINVPGGSPVRVTERNAKEFDVFFPGPPRAVTSIQGVTGQFLVTMPAKSLDFAFKTPKQGDRQARDGVQVAITEIVVEEEGWTVELTAQVPEAGPKFDSYLTWLGSKAWLDQSGCRFERGAGDNQEVLRPNPLYTQIRGSPSAARVAVRYQFMPGKNTRSFESWRLICHVPGRMVEVKVPLAFANIELP